MEYQSGFNRYIIGSMKKMETGTYIKPKHRQLTEALRNRLIIENLNPGDRFLTVREIAEKYKVSLITSHRSIQELVAQNLLTVEPPKGCFVGNGIRVLQEGAKNPLIIVLTSESYSSHDMVPESFIRGIRERLPLARIVLEFLPSQDPIRFLKAHVDAYTGTEMRAYVLRSVDASIKRFFSERNLPAIVTGNLEPNIDLPCVQRDERQIAYSVTRYLAGNGHSHIAYVEANIPTAGALERFSGFKNALLDMGITRNLEKGENFIERVLPNEANTSGAIRKILANAANRPTAIICGSEHKAAWSMRTIHQIGLKIPQDIAIVSLEGGMLVNNLIPRVTNVSRNDYEQGTWVGNFLVRLLQGDPLPERVHRIAVSLEEHETT